MGRRLRFRNAVVMAAVAHLAVGLFFGLARRNHGALAQHPLAPLKRLNSNARELEVSFLDAVVEPTTERAVVPSNVAARTPLADVASNAVPATRAAIAPRSDVASNAVPATPQTNPLPQNSDAAASSTASELLATNETNSTNDVVVSNSDVNPNANLNANPAGSGEVNQAQVVPHSPLTREQLGLTLGSQLKLEAQVSPVQREMLARQELSSKLARSIQQVAVEQAGKLGLGPEGAVLSNIERLALTNAAVSNGFATFTVRILEGGKIDFNLLGTSTDRAAWNTLFEQAKRELAGKKLLPPKGSRGIEYEIRVESRVQMPSGADPGFRISAFGKELKKGEGKRANGIDLFPSLPKLRVEETEMPNGERALAQRLELPILRAPFDLADLSGKRSRIVSAHVLRRTVL